MKVSARVDGMNALNQRMRALSEAGRWAVEVYVAGARNQKIAGYHASPEPRTKMPYRNPFFVQTGAAGRARDQMIRGLRGVAAGRGAESFRPVMEKIGKDLAEGMQRHIKGELGEDTRSKAEPVGPGSKMTPLSPDYARRKAGGIAIARAASGLRGVSGQRGGFKPGRKWQGILQRTGELMASIRSRVVTGA